MGTERVGRLRYIPLRAWRLHSRAEIARSVDIRAAGRCLQDTAAGTAGTVTSDEHAHRLAQMDRLRKVEHVLRNGVGEKRNLAVHRRGSAG